MRNSKSQIFATDKEIFDLLMSGKQKLTEATLREYARDRGIYFPQKLSREELSKRISTLPCSYNDLVTLIEKRDLSHRTKKQRSIHIHGDLSQDDLSKALKLVESSITEDESLNHVKIGDGKIKANIKYNEYDYSRTRLIQKREVDDSIEFSKTEEGYIVRFPANEKSEEIINRVIQKAKHENDNKIEPREISLANILESDKRNSFFKLLMTKMENYDLEDVVKVRVNTNMQYSGNDLEDDDDDDAEGSAQRMLHEIKTASLSGNRLMESPTYQNLQKSGYYITLLAWIAKRRTHPYHKVQFHAEFRETEDCRSFAYSFKYAPWNDSRSDNNKTLQNIAETELKDELSICIESTAEKAISMIVSSDESDNKD